ncbi:hypothetical protein HNP99_003235 [Flavobacterium sp. 28A]|uniref:hypothetical protein n=1 Tax=Flavobacterium sp. 28A TaxID=2735895 RepID=UPI0015706414|nr:hypothetical protein [Flavobacterium sp. 28A]NRT16861.1 hypothetical protein [Flavobacterium sp. 28A]
MTFCVLIKISKYKVSFWYQSERNPYAPLVRNDLNEIPLYFYVNGNDFIFGNAMAKERFNSNHPDAFGNYFEIIKNPTQHFNIYGNAKPVKQLLYYGIEQYLSHFINAILFKNDSIESYRQNFPLRFWFDTDLEENEKSLIENLFLEAGYDNIERVNFNKSLLQTLSINAIIKSNMSVLLLNGINNDLYLELFKDIKEPAQALSKLLGQGADVRINILADMILEDILIQNSYLTVNKEHEIAMLLAYSSELLEKSTTIIKGKATLTDGKEYFFEVNKISLNERLLYSSNDNIMYATIDDLLKVNNTSISNTIILLGSKEINTSYLLKKLLSKYPNVIGVEKVQSNDAMKLIFSKIANSGYMAIKNTNVSPPVITIPPPVQRSKIVVNSVTRINTPPILNVPPKIKTPPIINIPQKITLPPPQKTPQVILPTKSNKYPPPPPPIPKK